MTTTPEADAAAELLMRRQLRGSFEAWCRHVLASVNQAPARHHLALIRELEALARGDIDRLMILMPPGSAKSTYASVLFPAWLLAQRLGGEVTAPSLIGASHTAELAESFSRKVMGLVRQHSKLLGYDLGDSQSASLWTTNTGGVYRAVGVGGAVSGHRADVVTVDDPIKSREDAESERSRDIAFDWYRADITTRLKPRGRMLLIQTRWHQDDLAGRILETEGGRWRVVKFPALAEADDPLGRALDEPLWAEWEDAAALAAKRLVLGERDWAGLFQQRPVPLQGGLFDVSKFGFVDVAPTGRRYVRAWDLAATASLGTSRGDWTVGVKAHRVGWDGRYTIVDVIRMRGEPWEVERRILETAQMDGVGCDVLLPQDPGQAGKAMVAYLTRQLSGFVVKSSPETGSKELRAAPFASQVAAGNVSLLRADWNRVYIEELRSFPSGTFDDCVDASSRAFSVLALTQPPVRFVSVGFDSRPAGQERGVRGIDRSKVGQRFD